MKTYTAMQLIYFVRLLLDNRSDYYTKEEYRSLLCSLFSLEFGLISTDDCELIIQLVDEKLTGSTMFPVDSLKATRRALFLKLRKNKYILPTFSKSTRYYHLTDSGMNMLWQQIQMLFHTLGYDASRFISWDLLKEASKAQTAKLRAMREPEKHAQYINQASLIAVIKMPLSTEYLYSYEKEFCFQTGKTMGSSPKSEGSIESDFLLTLNTAPDHPIAFELDLGTEKITGNHASAILKKCAAYSTLYETTPCDVVFLLEEQETFLSQQKSQSVESEERLSHFKNHKESTPDLVTLNLIIKQYQAFQNNSSNATIQVLLNDLQTLSEENAAPIPIPKTRWFQILQFLHDYCDQSGTLHEHALPENERGMLPVSMITQTINELYEESPPAQSLLLRECDPQASRKRKWKLYEALFDNFSHSFHIQNQCEGIFRGQRLVLSKSALLWSRIPFIFELSGFSSVLPILLENIGLTNQHTQQKVTDMGSHPIAPLNRSPWHKHMNGLLYGRNTYSYGGITLCFENISDDLGGLLRLQAYLSLPYGEQPNIMMIALVDGNTFELANGTSLYGKSLYVNTNYAGNRVDSLLSRQEKVLARFLKDHPIPVQDEYVPFWLPYSQDIIFLTYEEFQKAFQEPVSPWTISISQKKRIPKRWCDQDQRLSAHFGTEYSNV